MSTRYFIECNLMFCEIYITRKPMACFAGVPSTTPPPQKKKKNPWVRGWEHTNKFIYHYLLLK